MVDVCLLGCGGMMPLPERRLTALLYRYKGKMILIDCGEGTQVPIRLAGWGFKSIEAICFTHYHADHIAGLPGLLLTIANSDRKEPLTLFGPPGLNDIIKGLTVIAPVLPFELILVELPDGGLSTNMVGEVFIKSISVDHAIPCLAYSIEIKRAGKFDVERATNIGVSKEFWSQLQKGEVIVHEGKRYEPDMVLGKPRKGLKVTYCTDTRPTRTLVDFTLNSDLFICEGFYGEDEKRANAIEKQHMIFSEAADIAKRSGSSELWLTHYSPSLKEPKSYIQYAKNIFPNSVLGEDLMIKSLFFEDK